MSAAELGGGTRGRFNTRLVGREREAGLAHARAWRERMRPIFDAMDANGEFADSMPPSSPFARRAGE
jgi:hypothetical protein